MHRKNLMLSGAAALAFAAAAFAVPPALANPIPAATSYADLFENVPNAAAKLSAADAFEQAQAPRLLQAQYWRGDGGPYYHHHHHHHHHHHSSRWYYDQGYVWSGWGWVRRPIYHHHHHHHRRCSRW